MQKLFRKISLIGAGTLPFVPLVAYAQATDVKTLLQELLDIINLLIPFLIAVAVLLFIIGVVGFVTAGDSEEKRTSGRNRMVWGIIAIFVIVSVWGLVNILINTFDLDVTVATSPVIPTLP